MDFYVMAKSHDCYGGHTTLSPVGDFLLMGSIGFGDAVKELRVTLYLPDSGPARKTLEGLLESYNSYRSTLPKITYRKKTGKVEIAIASEAMDARDWKPSARLSLPLFVRAVDEIVGALPLMGKRLKDSDAFNLNAFVSHCQAARQRIPGSEDALQELAANLIAANQARREAMSPWERLDIDWDDFHPKARQILDDPFFWDCANDFAPNGNDTGADLLESYRGWLKRHRDGLPMQFMEHLARKWGYANLLAMDEDVLNEAGVGLAFADMKLRGSCEGPLRALAMKCLLRQREQAEAATDWPHRGERLASLKKIETKLQQNG